MIEKGEEVKATSKLLGPPGAVLFGILFSLAFLSRHEQTTLAIFGAIGCFCVGAGWMLAAGRLRWWLITTSQWPKRLQGLVFISTFLGIPLLIAILLVQVSSPHS
jgi:threonine/homoserine/homoserine lactone efflux protein